MSKLSNLKAPNLETVTISVQAPNTIRWRGTITTKDPGVELAGFTSAAHCAALDDGLAELTLDISELTFVNSSAIRLFIDWAMWVKDSKREAYKLRFRTSRRVTWQKTSLMALRTIAGDVLSVEHVD